jgi:hypothetical protein
MSNTNMELLVRPTGKIKISEVKRLLYSFQFRIRGVTTRANPDGTYTIVIPRGELADDTNFPCGKPCLANIISCIQALNFEFIRLNS